MMNCLGCYTEVKNGYCMACRKKLFPFFYGLLSEGINKDIQCRLYKIDENDDFTRLLLTAREDTIGSITVKAEDDAMFRMLY